MDISIFEDLHSIAKKDIKDTEVSIKLLSKEIIDNNLGDITDSIKERKSEWTKIEIERRGHIAYIEGCDVNILKMTKALNDDTKVYDMSAVNRKKNEITTQILAEENKQERCVVLIESYQQTLDKQTSNPIAPVIGIDELIEETRKEIKKAQNQRAEIMDEVTGWQTHYNMNEESIDRLSTHKYDPNCKYCVQNPFVLAAEDAKKNQPNVEKLINDGKSIIIKLDSKLVDLNAQLEDGLKQKKLISDIQTNTLQLISQKQQLETSKQLVKSLNDTWDSLVKIEEDYEKQKEQIILNKELKAKIKDQQDHKQTAVTRLSIAEKSLASLHSAIEVLKSKYEIYTTKQDQLTELNNEYSFYEVYLDAINRDGVPHQILTKILPVIENEVNLILNQIVNFTVRFDTDDSQHINCYIDYNGGEDSWSVELASGMERFIISIATRVALINVTSLPRPNFIAIDEGFGVLDSDKLNSVYLLFELLKSQFEFILCISHLDTMKDLADNSIGIIKDAAGYSKIYT